MTRLPELERQLLAAARRLDRPAPVVADLAARRRCDLRVAATASPPSGLLPRATRSQAPPAQRVEPAQMQPGTSRRSARAPRTPRAACRGASRSRARRTGKLFCVQVGRVQDDTSA